MVITWPQNKGWPLPDDFEATLPDIAERSSVDAGPAKQRRITTAAPFRVEISYMMTSAERDWLTDETTGFYFVEAAGGGVWFDWWYPVKKEWRQARFMVGSPPRFRPFKPDWVVSVSLEVR